MNKNQVKGQAESLAAEPAKGTKRPYVKPACGIISVEPANLICASVSPNPIGSSESSWSSETVHEGDHTEWFGTTTEVAP